MKIIFLDIDGVLNGYNPRIYYFYRIMYVLRLNKLARSLVDIFGVHESKVKRLAKIVKATDAKIVVSSSWRRAWSRYASGSGNHIPQDIYRLAKLFHTYNIPVIGTTGYDSQGRRGIEILQWLAKHESEVYSFCIIDDDEKFDIESLFSDRLIYTGSKDYRTGYWGLRNKHISQAIAILNDPLHELPSDK